MLRALDAGEARKVSALTQLGDDRRRFCALRRGREVHNMQARRYRTEQSLAYLGLSVCVADIYKSCTVQGGQALRNRMSEHERIIYKATGRKRRGKRGTKTNGKHAQSTALPVEASNSTATHDGRGALVGGSSDDSADVAMMRDVDVRRTGWWNSESATSGT